MAVVLTVDIGNTTTRFGLLAVDEVPGTGVAAHDTADEAAEKAPGEPAGSARKTPDNGAPALRLLGSCELTTRQPVTADETRITLAQVMDELPAHAIDGSILSCVVPTLTSPWHRALAVVVPGRQLVVGPGLRSGIRLRFNDPSEVGSDRIADAVAARATYGAPAVVVDLGTTTNFEAIDAAGAFCGGIIAPGVAIGARALAEAAARLPVIELKTPEHALGRSTREAMQSGVVLGEAARIDGLLDAILGELEGDAPIIMTGENAEAIARLLRHEAIVDDTLTLRGLALIWHANQRG